MPSAIAPEDTSTTSRPPRFKRGDLVRPVRDRRVVEAAAVVGDEARADLDDEALGVGDELMRSDRCAGGACAPARATRRPAPPCVGIGLRGRAGCASSHSWIGERELAAAFAVDRGDREHRTLPAIRLDERLHALLALVFRHEVELVQHEPARLVVAAPRRSASSSFDDRARVVHGIGVFVERRDVDDVQQQARALQVAQEAMTEARAVGRAFDEARDVGDDEARGSRSCAPRRGSGASVVNG